MGRLSEAHRQGRIRLGGRGISEEKKKAPLKKIVGLVEHTTDLFDQDVVKLECGHTVKSNGQYRARCMQCWKEENGG